VEPIMNPFEFCLRFPSTSQHASESAYPGGWKPKSNAYLLTQA
jgi:hypothetical protein